MRNRIITNSMIDENKSIFLKSFIEVQLFIDHLQM